MANFKKFNKTAIVAVALIICVLLTACSSAKGTNLKKGLENAVKLDKFKNVQVDVTYSFEMIPTNEEEQRQVEKEDHSGLDGGSLIKYGDLYYQESVGREIYHSNEDGTDYIYYRYSDNNYKDIGFTKYYAEDFKGDSQLEKLVNFSYFSSITPEMFEKFDKKTGSCFATDKYEKAIIQTIFPNNSFDKLSDISLEFIIDDDLICEIIYRYTFDNSTKFVMNYELNYNEKKIELPKKYSDLT